MLVQDFTPRGALYCIAVPRCLPDAVAQKLQRPLQLSSISLTSGARP